MVSHDSDANESADLSTGNPSYAVRFTRFSRPLIDSVRNGWQSHSNPAYHALSSSPSPDSKHGGWVQMAWSVISAPRFRRYVVVYLTLFLLGWAGWALLLYPRLQERAHLLHSLDPATKIRFGWFGTNSMPRFDDLIQIGTLDPSLVPGAPLDGETTGTRKRLVVVGDVHGCKEELLKLLDEVSFSREDGDHLIFTGDIINKGPDSSGVVNLARELHASCVRGNHEDRILLHRQDIKQKEIAASKGIAGAEERDKEFFSTKELEERELARSLTEEQAQWLNACPIILKIGQIPGMGQVVVVHGGLVPDVELEKQDPSTVMTMRSIDMDTHVPSASNKGLKWAKVFDKHQSMVYSSVKATSSDPRSETMTVIYGHDAKAGLSIRDYTKGLDSGCVRGGRLTALVIEDGGKQSLVQVRCRGYVKD